MSFKRLSRNAFGAGAIIGILASVLFVTGSLEPYERTIYDSRLRSTALGSLDRSVTIVGITETDIQEFGYPDGEHLAPLLDRLQALGASDIVIDIPIRAGDPTLPRLLEAASEGNVVFGFEFLPKQVLDLERGLPPSGRAVPEDVFRVGEAVGFINRAPSSDGVLRRFTPQVGELPEIAVAAAATVGTNSVRLPRQAPMVGEQIRFGPGPRLLIRYDLPPDNFSYSSMDEVMLGARDFKDKTVLVGLVDPSVATIYRTPLGPMPHVLVTGQIVSAIVRGRGITRSPVWLVVVAVVLVSMAMALGAAQARPVADVLLPLVAGVLIWVISNLAFRSGTLVDVMPLAVALVGHVLVMPLVRRAHLSAERGWSRAEANLRRFADCMIETLTLGSFAHSGKIWLFDEGEKQILTAIGEVPEHLAAAVPEGGPAEANRDEGQVVLIPIMLGDQRVGGAALIRRRSPQLSTKRLNLLFQIATTFMARIEEAGEDAKGVVLLETLFKIEKFVEDESDEHVTERFDVLVTSLGKQAGLTNEQVQALATSIRLHDLGNLGVPDAVLDSNERLTDEEYERVKKHPLVSRQILEAARADCEVIRIVTSHHERWDGKGYPEGKSGEDIPLAARVLAIADAVTSMTSDRPYRRAITLSVALEEIERQRGRMFDPQLVDLCLELARKSPSLFGGPGGSAAPSSAMG